MLLTFHPTADFQETMAMLDTKRLRRLLQNVKDILREIDSGKKQSKATRMWQSYVPALVRYGIEVCWEMKRRGFNISGSIEFIRSFTKDSKIDKLEMPPWLKMKQLHTSHRAWLLSKNHSHYRKFKWKVPKGTPLFWPTEAKMKGLKPLVNWTPEEMMRCGWKVLIDFDRVKNVVQVKFYMGQYLETAIHVVSAEGNTVERAMQLAVRTFMKEVAR